MKGSKSKLVFRLDAGDPDHPKAMRVFYRVIKECGLAHAGFTVEY
jgi:hypothetical protein